MKPTPILRLGIFLAIALGFSQRSYAQQITYVSPYPLTLHGCSASPKMDEVYAGDYGYLVLWLGGQWYSAYSDTSVTFYAACYLNDNDLAIAGSKGTVLYSTNSGLHWTEVKLGTTATIRALASDRIGDYFAVGDSGMILKSSNKGATWMRLSSPVTKQLNAIEFGAGGKYGVAAGNDSAIVVTTDGGQNWNAEPMPYNLSSVGSQLTRVDFSSVAISKNADSVWVGLEIPALPLLLINGKADPNQKFTVFPNSGPLTSMVYTGDTSWAYLQMFAADDYAYNLTPEGVYTRNVITIGGDADGNVDTTAQRFRCAAYEPIPGGGYNVICAGDDLELCRQDQAGTAQFMVEPGHAFGADYLDAAVVNGRGWIVGSGGIIDWMNTGTFSRYIQRRENVTVNSVWTNDGITGIAVGWDGLILRTEDSGFMWQTIPSNTQERLHGIAFPTTSKGIIVGDYGTILRSTDTGITWNPIANPATTYLRTVAFSDDHTGIAAGDSATILRTTDTGRTWLPINNLLSGTNISIRKVQAFPGGTYFAQAGPNLLKSTDDGLNWSILPSPGDTIAMSFYNAQIGLIGSQVSSSAVVPDFVAMAYTTDGGADWTRFGVPMQTARRVVIYWLNSQQAILNGIDGWVMEVTITPSGVMLTPIAQPSDLTIYPNPTSGQFRIDYTTKTSGPITIQLFSEDGKDMGTLFNGTVPAGAHEQALTAPQDLHGSFYLRITKDDTVEMVPVRFK